MTTTIATRLRILVASIVTVGISLPAIALSADAVIRATTTDMPAEAPSSPAWTKVPLHRVTLTTAPVVHPSNPGKGATARELTVQAVRNSDQLFIRLDWPDKRADRKIANINQFTDGVAVQFAIERDPETSVLMGGGGKLVDVWHWTASKDRAQNFIADGFGTLTPMEKQAVSAKSQYANGRWTVVFRRSLKAADESWVKFVGVQGSGGSAVYPVAFAVWDGSNGEIDGFKAVTMAWQQLAF